MPYTTITVRDSISSVKPAAIVFSNGDKIEILDGLDGNALRGIARLLTRAADHADESEDVSSSTHGATQFSLSYEVEWDNDTGEWPSEGFTRNGSEMINNPQEPE